MLGEYGFAPISPPSNLMNVGSLYYVDSQVKDFRAICNAEKDDLKDSVVSSRSWELQRNRERNGRLATGVKVDVGWLLNGGVDKNYVMKVHSALTDIILDESPLGSNWVIFAKLMEKPQCSQVAMRYIRAGGYVCRGQKILHPTAQFQVDRHPPSKRGAHSTAPAHHNNEIAEIGCEPPDQHRARYK